MARPSTKPRLDAVDPSALALATARQAIELYAAEAGSLFGSSYRPFAPGAAPEDADLRKTPSYRSLRAIGEYARGNGELDNLSAQLDRLLPLLRRALARQFEDLQELLALLDTLAQQTPLGVVLCGAWARAELAANRPISAIQLAVLSGSSPASIGNLIRADELPAKRLAKSETSARSDRWVIAAAEARRFLRAARGS